MYLDSKFDGESDFFLKRGLNPQVDWSTEGQSQNLVKWHTTDVPGKERVNLNMNRELVLWYSLIKTMN